RGRHYVRLDVPDLDPRLPRGEGQRQSQQRRQPQRSYRADEWPDAHHPIEDAEGLRAAAAPFSPLALLLQSLSAHTSACSRSRLRSWRVYSTKAGVVSISSWRGRGRSISRLAAMCPGCGVITITRSDSRTAS